MPKTISAAEYSLAKIFCSDFDFVIPPYQRPYAWTTVQAGELFADLYDFFIKEKVEDTYFLGSIILIKGDAPSAEVIDGQQRLTTLTILLAALSDQTKGTIRDIFNNYLCQPGNPVEGLAEKPRLRLRERDRDFFKDYIQAVRFDDLIAKDPEHLENESQRNVQANARLFQTRLMDAFGGDQKALTNFGSFLVQRCFLVAVSTVSQESACRLFSVLNSRGLNLLPTDIIKAEVIGKVGKSDQDRFTEIWEQLEVDTGRDGFSEVFSHIRMIYAKEKARRALTDEFREKVIAKAALSPEYLVSQIIQPYTEIYLTAKQCQYISSLHAQEINGLLGWLNRIDNSDWLPLAMRFLKDSPTSDYVLWFFSKLERLAAYMHICGHDVNARITRYAKVLSGLDKSHSLTVPVTAVELDDSEKKAMREALDGLIYQLAARRRNYLILRLDSFLACSGASYDPTVLTIEHVLPQTVNTGSEWENWWPNEEERQKWLHRIANLVPLSRQRNSMAQNHEFRRKKTDYFTGRSGVSSYALTSQVLTMNTWMPIDVFNRQKALLNIFEDKWELK